MGPKTKLVLLSSAASFVVVTAPHGTARAADQPAVAAPTVDYVETCRQYGYGWIRYPGTAFCLKFVGKLSTTVDGYQRKPTFDMMQDTKDTHYTPVLITAEKQDSFGVGSSVVFGAMARTVTTWGQMSAGYQYQISQTSGADGNQGAFPTSAGGALKFPNSKLSNGLFGANVSYSWGPLGNVAVGRFSSEYQYFAKGDFGLNPYDVGNTRINHGYYQWNSSGSSNDPVGWTLQMSFEDPLGHGDGGQWGSTRQGLDGNPCAVGTAPPGGGILGAPGNNGGIGACNGFGGIDVTVGPTRFFDVVPNVRWLDDEWGSVFTAMAIHQISYQAIADSGNGAAGVGNCLGAVQVNIKGAGAPGNCTTGIGTVSRGLGWAGMVAILKNLPRVPGNAPFARDLIVVEYTYGYGAMDEGGFKVSNTVRGGSPPFNEGGFLADDHDAIAIPLAGGGYMLEREQYQTFNFEYKHYINSCTDPDWCWNFHLNTSEGWIRPGTITQNTDWTKGGLGKYFGYKFEAGVHWGVAELTWEVELDAQYSAHKQDLGHDPGLGPTPLPATIAKDSGAWWFALGMNRNFGGSVGKNLAGF